MYVSHSHLGDPLPQLGPLPLALAEASVQVVELRLHLLLLVLHVLLGAAEGAQVSAEVRLLLLQSLLRLLQTRSHLGAEGGGFNIYKIYLY